MTRMLPWIALLAACGPNDEAWSPGCDETTTPLTRDETSALGFTAADLLDPLAAPLEVGATHADDTTTQLTITVTPDDDGIVLVQRTVSEPPPGTRDIPAIFVICDDSVRVPATISLATDDGLFDESAPVLLEATTADLLSWTADLGSTLTGTFEPDDADLEELDEWSYGASGDFVGSQTAGQIDLLGEGSSGSGPDAISFASRVELLTWSSAAE